MAVNDIRIRTTFFNHPKTVRLRRRLGADAVISLQQLWSWASEYRPKGNLDGLTDEEIEFAASWTGEQGKLCQTLRELHWLDDCGIHDWQEHQPWVFDSDKRSSQARRASKARHDRHGAEEEDSSDATDSTAESNADSTTDSNADSSAESNAECQQNALPLSSPLLSLPLPSSPYQKAKGARVVLPACSQRLEKAIRGWMEYRKAARKPITQEALDRALSKVRKWCPDDESKQADLFDCAVDGGWQGIYWPKSWGSEPGKSEDGDEYRPTNPAYRSDD